MKPRFITIILCLLLAGTMLPVAAAPTARYAEDGRLPAITEPEEGILPLIFCRNTTDLTAGDVTWEEGRDGQAAMLDGTSTYFRGEGTLLQGEALSFSLWVNWLDADTLPTGQRLLSIRGADRNARYMALSPNGGENGEGLCLEMQVGADTVALNADNPTPLPAGWHHIAVVWEDTSLRLYLDGVLLDEKIAPASPDSFDVQQMCVGKGMRSVTDGFSHAAVDDVYLYNRALTSAEVATLAGLPEETTTTTDSTTTTTATTAGVTASTLPAGAIVPDPLQPTNQLWLLGVPVVALLLLLATALPWKRKR